MKYTVITGASSGIGYEAALAFAARGKHLMVAARREEELQKLKKEVQQINESLEVIVYTGDLSSAEEAHRFYESLKNLEVETFINNAGFGNYDPIAQQDLNKVEKMLNLNINTLTILSTLFAKDYADTEGTQLINVSSRGGYTIVEDAVTYCATKFYVSAFTEGLARELKLNGSRMQAKVLAPAATETEFAKRAKDMDKFDYSESVAKFHTAKEMAGFLLDLYDSEKAVGIVNSETYEFELKDPLLPFAERKR